MALGLPGSASSGSSERGASAHDRRDAAIGAVAAVTFALLLLLVFLLRHV